MPPTVSIIIPVYNAEAYLQATLESALSQDYDDLEVVAVNDGSRDGSQQILDACPDPRLKVVHQDNAGQCAASNRGIRESSGDLLKFLDQDDLLAPGHIAAQVAALGTRTDAVASCRWVYFRDEGNLPEPPERVTDRDYSDPVEWIKDTLTRDTGMMGAWQWLIPRPLLERAGNWDERISLENDFDMTIRVLLAADSIRFGRGATVYYRTGLAGSLSKVRSRKALESVMLATRKGTDALLARDGSPAMRRLCANRFQKWLYQMYPAYPDLAGEAEKQVQQLGGSTLQLQGGCILRLLSRVLNWRQIRWLQHHAYCLGWKRVIRYKARRTQ